MSLQSHILPSSCPHCGRGNQIHSSEGSEGPVAGDLSVCFNCLQVCEFDEHIHLAKLSPKTQAMLQENTELRNQLDHYKFSILAAKLKYKNVQGKNE